MLALAAFDTLVHVEAANAAAFCRIHRLAIHDDDRRPSDRLAVEPLSREIFFRRTDCFADG